MAESHAAGAPEPAPDSAGAQDGRAPIVTAPDLPAGPRKQLERSGSRLGRSALFVHGLGVAFALVAAAVLYFGAWDFHGDDPFVLMAVGGGALIACTLWSVILAVRAARSRERLLLPAVLGLIVWTEASAALLATWLSGIVYIREAAMWPWAKALVQAVFRLGLPVLMPVALLSLLLAWPLSRIMLRIIEKRRTARDKENGAALAVARRRRSDLVVVAFLLLFVLLLLPVPLALFCASTSAYRGVGQVSDYYYWMYERETPEGKTKDLAACVVGALPGFVNGAAETLALALPGATIKKARFMIVRFQVLDLDRVEEIALDARDDCFGAAWLDLQERDPERAANAARRLWNLPGGVNGNQSLSFLNSLRPEVAKLLLADLNDIAGGSKGPQAKQIAIGQILNLAPYDQAYEMADQFVRSPNLQKRQEFYRRYCWMIRDSNRLIDFVLPGLGDADPKTVVMTLHVLVYRLPQDTGLPMASVRKIVGRCADLLDHPNREVRRTAVRLLLQMEQFDAAADLKYAVSQWQPSSPRNGEAEDDPQILNKVRAAAEAWLKEHNE